MPEFKISIIIPVHNEEGNIEPLCKELEKILQPYPSNEILFVDDGSMDNSLGIIKKLQEKNPKVKFISFSRNFGHQLALKAGLDNCDGDCVISMDGDMQHPPELIPLMIQKWQEGFEIVYTIRKEEPNLSYFKKMTSSFFYSMMNFLSDLKMEKGTADFRLLDRRVVESIKKFNEPYLFLRGLVSWLGFKQYGIPYSPNERFSGKPKYSFKKMFFFAINGITSFSVKPLKISVVLGLIISFLALIYGIYAIALSILNHAVISGWTSLIVSILFIGGLQLMMMGIIGIYLGQIFIQTKNRPNYIIKERSNP